MSKAIQVLRGKEIGDTKVQEKIETIHNSWLSIENPPFEDESIEFGVVYEEDEYCILGSDWFLFYTVEAHEEVENILFIDFFEATQYCENQFRRSIEMFMAFKMLARKYKDFLIEADANQYSFPFYELFLRKGLIAKFCEEAPNDSRYRNVQFYINPNSILSRTKP